jgi:DNA polymerase-3 subunit epsilon
MNFVTIDFETADYSPRSACSVGLVKYQESKKVDTFYSLIRPPELYIRPDFTEIHGLTVDDVKTAPTFEELWESKIRPFIGDLPLAAHNANFDIGVLLATLEWYRLPKPALRYFCSLQLSRRTWPFLKSHALTSLANEFGISYNAHNALDDAETCGRIILLAAEKFICACLEELLRAANTRMMMIRGQTEPLSKEEINQLLEAIGAEPYESDSLDYLEDCFDDEPLDEDSSEAQ